MPRILSPIPDGVVIVDKSGAINEFFRLRWQELIDGFRATPTVAVLQYGPPTGAVQTGALATTTLFTTTVAGYYRVTAYLRKTSADGVASTLSFTWGWTDSGFPLTETQAPAALAVDAIGAQASVSKTFWADANVSLTIAVPYTSNTPGNMKWRGDVTCELLQ